MKAAKGVHLLATDLVVVFVVFEQFAPGETSFVLLLLSPSVSRSVFVSNSMSERVC